MKLYLARFCVAASVCLFADFAPADIFRWDNGQLIPGTEGVTPGPGVQLDHRELAFAKLDRVNLTGANLEASNLSDALLTNANIHNSILTDANLAGAAIRGTIFSYARGFTSAQLYSTASYKAKDLEGVDMWGNDLSGWDFSGQNLTNAHLNASSLKNANLTDAIVRGTDFYETTRFGFTAAQLYSTASYQAKDLIGIRLVGNDLSGWNFSGQNLTNARFALIGVSSNLTNADLSGTNLSNAVLLQSNVANANLTGAVVRGADFGGTSITSAQIYSTASYQAKDLQEIGLQFDDLSGWNFRGQNLSGAYLFGSTLTNADLTGAVIRGAKIYHSGFISAQLYSTASYIAKDLREIDLGGNDLTGWDFSGQNLTDAFLISSNLTNVNLTGAVVRGTSFYDTTRVGVFSAAQLYSTASYQLKDLQGIDLGSNDLRDWNFTRQNLSGASFYGANLTNANFSFADLRGVNFFPEAPTIVRNAILPDGTINSLNLVSGEKLVAFPDVPIPVKIVGELSIANNATLDLTDNAAIVDHAGTSPVAAVRQQIIAGRDGSGIGGEWTGTGITSSTAAAANATQADSRSLGYTENAMLPLGPYSTFQGAPVDGTAVLMAYTRTGDANLDGVVNDDDVTIVGATYAPGMPQASWALGDFDYNGFVDDDDVTLLGVFYDPSAMPLAVAGSSSVGVAAVPEPNSVALAAIALVGLAIGGLLHRVRFLRAFPRPSAG